MEESPLLTAGDAAALRVAHQYHNAAYHRGRAQPSDDSDLATIHSGTVTRVWKRLCEGHWSLGVYGTGMAERLVPLERYGIAGSFAARDRPE